MKNILRVSAVVLTVAALSTGAATVAQAQTFTITENFNAATPGSAAQPLFAAAPITVAYAARASESDPWEPDFGFPLNVETAGGNNVLGDGAGAIIFALQPNYIFSTFSIDFIGVDTPFGTDTTSVFFQDMTGVSLGTFEFDRATGGTPLSGTLTLSLPAGTAQVIVPIDAQYDNVSLVAVTVPEAGALPLALGGLLTLAGAVVVRRRK
ncbi:MAG: hypothetical protein H7Y38_18520 [Armatimonadetes bacterium]|nr:hypothetical protein [Armatimonadota bacterium]